MLDNKQTSTGRCVGWYTYMEYERKWQTLQDDFGWIKPALYL